MQIFQDEVEVPGSHSDNFALLMPTAIDNTYVEPLLAQHCEEGSGQTRVKDGLDVDDGGTGAIPLRERDIVAS